MIHTMILLSMNGELSCKPKPKMILVVSVFSAVLPFVEGYKPVQSLSLSKSCFVVELRVAFEQGDAVAGASIELSDQ